VHNHFIKQKTNRRISKMKIETGMVMVDMEGNELRDQIPSGQKNVMGQDILKEGPALTLKTVAINALVATYQDETNLSGEEKLSRWELAGKIKKSSGAADLSVEEVSLVKKLIGKAYGTLICGQAWKVLEGGV
jgi:hypothetical protein